MICLSNVLRDLTEWNQVCSRLTFSVFVCVCVCVCNPLCVPQLAPTLLFRSTSSPSSIQYGPPQIPSPYTHTPTQGTMNDSLTCRLLCMLPLKHLYSLTHEISFECCSPPHCSPLITIHQFSIACISMFPKLLFTTTADIQRNNFTYVFQL